MDNLSRRNLWVWDASTNWICKLLCNVWNANWITGGYTQAEHRVITAMATITPDMKVMTVLRKMKLCRRLAEQSICETQDVSPQHGLKRAFPDIYAALSVLRFKFTRVPSSSPRTNRLKMKTYRKQGGYLVQRAKKRRCVNAVCENDDTAAVIDILISHSTVLLKKKKYYANQ